MSEYASIYALWREHLRRPFPKSLKGAEIEGVCLVSMDSATAGCIDGFFGGTRPRPNLDAGRVKILSDCAATLARVCPQLADEDRAYFETLRDIADRIVTFCRRASHE